MTSVKVQRIENNADRRHVGSLLPIFALLLSGMAASQRPAITGISHVTLYADDIAHSRQFYGELLGWKAVPATGSAPGLRFYPNHKQYVELLPPPVQGQAHRLDLVCFATDDAEGLRRLLASKGIVVPSSITVERDGSRSFLVHDPEGNSVEFTQQGRAIPSPPPSALDVKFQEDVHSIQD